jgi:hypothetical protein
VMALAELPRAIGAELELLDRQHMH